MKKVNTYFFVIISFFIANNLFSQTELHTFKIADETTKDPIQFCYVLIQGKKASAQSDENGIVKIKAVQQDTLVIYQLGYFLKKITADEITKTDNIILLTRKNVNLEEVTVIEKTVDVLQQNNNTVFLDFDFYDDFILCLVYKTGKYNSLQLLDKNGNKVYEKSLKIEAEKLFRDCLGNIHLLSKDSVYQVFYDYQSIILLPPFPVKDFYAVLQPCECQFADRYIFKAKHYHSQRNIYSFYDLENHNKKILICVADSENIRDFNMDFDIRYFIKMRKNGVKEYQTSITEIVKHKDYLRERIVLTDQYANLLPPLLSEIKRIDTNFVLFDYTNKLAYFFSLNGDLQNKIPLNNNFLNITPKLYIDDDVHNYIFSSLNNNTGILTLYRYDLTKNTFTHTFILKDFHFIKEFKIKENYLYFIHKNRATAYTKTKIVKTYIKWEKL